MIVLRGVKTLLFIAKTPINNKMSKKAKEHFDYLFSRDIELFRNEVSGELYSKITNVKTGVTKIFKCEYIDE